MTLSRSRFSDRRLVQVRETLEAAFLAHRRRVNVAFRYRDAAVTATSLIVKASASASPNLVKNVWRIECITQSFGSCKSYPSFL